MIFTLGHSNRTVQEFLHLLRRSGIRQLADIRRYPRSKRNPHFDSDNLEYILNVSWVTYRHVESLGAYREVQPNSPHTALAEALRGYADHLPGAEAQQAIEELLAWSRGARTAVLCAEADPYGCHRHLLADHLQARGERVVHILDAERIVEHRLSALGRMEDGTLIYDAGRLELGF